MSPKIYMLEPGEDPTTKKYETTRPSCSGCFVKIGIVLTLIVAGLWIFFQSRSQPQPAQELVALPSATATHNDWTRTPTAATDTPIPLPTNTVPPTYTPIPSGTPLPDWWGCTTGYCDLLPSYPGYNATKAMAAYQTAVAPLTPSNTPTKTQTPTQAPPTAVRRSNRVGGSSGGGGAARELSGMQALASAVPAVRYETAIPPIPASPVPTFSPLPNCTGGVIGLMSADPNVPGIQITTTPIPECVNRPTQPVYVPTVAPSPTSQEMSYATATLPSTEIPVSPTATTTEAATAEPTIQQ